MHEKTKKILVVEDESIIGLYLKSTLIQIGYDVAAVVISGEQAIQQVELTSPDLILMDINLPGSLDGIETAERIRTAHDLPIIYLTANSDDHVIERARVTEPFGYLIKPVHAKELHVTIEMAFYKHQMERSLRITNQHLEQEILERKQIEYELEKHRGHLEELVQERAADLKIAVNRLRTIIETVGEGITLSDETGYFEIFNSKMEQITGYTQEEANQSPDFLRLLYPDPRDYQQTLLGLQEARQHREGARDLETTITSKDGRQKTLLVSTSIIPDQNRDWYLSAYRDITERKRAEEELKNAKEAAEVANLAKSRFLANMSHELRTPLNAILGYAQIFKTADNLTNRQIDGLETIRSSGEHLLHLINEVLDLSKVESGKFELQRKEFHLPNFLAQIVKIMHIQAEQRRLSFFYEHDPNLPLWVYGDEQRLSEILMNLLGNAIKFTDAGQVNFRVKVTGKTQNHASCTATIRFEVEDTGIGIAPERFEEIFLPFQQIAFRRASMQGTGLGLTISRKFVEMMGGTLHVSSTPGRGSVFTFELTFPEVVRTIATERPHALNILGYEGERRMVLVADDHKGNRAILVERLTSIGFQVLETDNGQDCLDLALSHRPHAILLDLQMPVLNGFEVAQLIQTFPELSDVIVIAISASVYQEIRVQSLQAGCQEFLAKPIDFQTLLECLRRYLHLEWIYQEDSLASDRSEYPAETIALQRVLLPPLVRETLLELAELGIVKTLLAELQKLETQDVRFQPLTEYLRQFVKTYQFDQLIEFLQIQQEK
ncbi:multi-sensor hybrid histidine kinase [Candidatus Vecturithrix granuli]|uniref:histidine kinase n=1 Tax=Vecturithrix granuli TaxID=1499967 RepID=A0A0S6WB97_VECG1|nr:multi-sensor hybrid histidine kinase [Candidatus Vecturithrix granuli]